jgi:hypothetical protein
MPQAFVKNVQTSQSQYASTRRQEGGNQKSIKFHVISILSLILLNSMKY